MATKLEELGGRLKTRRTAWKEFCDLSPETLKEDHGIDLATADGRNRFKEKYTSFEKEVSELHDEYKVYESKEAGSRLNAEAIDDLSKGRRVIPFGDPGAYAGHDGIAYDIKGNPVFLGGYGGGAAVKSIGRQFVESDAYKTYRKGVQNQNASHVIDGRFDFKATLTSGTLTGYDRVPGIFMLGTTPLMIADLIAPGQTNQPTIRYTRENTFTNAATTVAEAATKPEESWDLVEADAPVRKIATTAKISEEMLDDFPAVMSYIDERLPLKVQLTEQAQLLNGNGTAPNIKGLLNTTGILTTAVGASPDDALAAIYRAIITIRFTSFYEPDGIAMNPLNWQPIRLLKETTGGYIWGHPAEVGVERVWGIPVVQTPSMATGTALVGAFRLGAQIFRRSGITITMTNSNEDDFKKNLVCIRAEERLALAVYRPAAFCTVTALP